MESIVNGDRPLFTALGFVNGNHPILKIHSIRPAQLDYLATPHTSVQGGDKDWQEIVTGGGKQSLHLILIEKAISRASLRQSLDFTERIGRYQTLLYTPVEHRLHHRDVTI